MAAAPGEAPEETPEDQKPKVDLAGLATELEHLDSVRAFLRSTKAALFGEKFNLETIHCVQQDHVYDIIRVLLNRIALVEGHPSPSVHQLRSELSALYQQCSVVVDDATTHQDAWCIRKIIAFIKMKIRKVKVSTATCLHIYRCLIWTYTYMSIPQKVANMND